MCAILLVGDVQIFQIKFNKSVKSKSGLVRSIKLVDMIKRMVNLYDMDALSSGKLKVTFL